MAKSSDARETGALSALLRDLREQKGFTQEELGLLLRRSQSLVSKLECGETKLGVVELRRICKALWTPIWSFMREYERRLGPGRKPRRR